MKRILGISLLALFILASLVQAIHAEPRIIFQMNDSKGDDYGAGKLLYPTHDVFVRGLFDLQKFEVVEDLDHLYFYFTLATLTNPFGAPEGYFHQRIDLYIHLEQGGNNEIELGDYLLKTSPEYGWQVHLAVAPFNETFILVETEGESRVYSEGITSWVLEDDRTILVQVDKNLLPKPEASWSYYVLVGSFDGLASDFWRDLGADSWQLRGEGVPVFDILAPRWGSKNQKRQLTQGLLYPVRAKEHRLKRYVLLLLGFVMLVFIFILWRWHYGRA